MPSKQNRKPKSSEPQARHAATPLVQTDLLGLLGYNLRRAYLPILAVFRERMAKFDLSPVDYTVLVLVRANPDVNQKRLARALNIEPPNMTTLLDRLESRGLLARERASHDKRHQMLVLTPAGRALCKAAEKVVARLEVDAAPNLTKGERLEMMRLAQKIFLH